MLCSSSAHSFLFVPGDRPERFSKATASGAHAVIIDLEDAVSPNDKEDARNNALTYLDSVTNEQVFVRINDADSTFYDDDLLVAKHANLAGVILPKANTLHTQELVRTLDRPVWPLVETALGVSQVKQIAQSPRVKRLLLGTIDLSLQLRLNLMHSAGQAMMDQARFALVSASHQANLPAPVDGVFPSLDDEAGLRRNAEYACAAGMGGMMCIHPLQLQAVHNAFAPSKAAVEWARAVLAASVSEKHSFRFRGQMVDKPILERAVSILDLCGEIS